MRRVLSMLLLFFSLLLTVTTSAQTPTFKLAWDQGEPIAQVQQFQYTLKVDGGTAVMLTATCTAKDANNSSCTAPLAPLTSGSHTLVLTVFNGFGSASSAPLSGAPPSTPLNITITITISIP